MTRKKKNLYRARRNGDELQFTRALMIIVFAAFGSYSRSGLLCASDRGGGRYENKTAALGHRRPGEIQVH